MKRLLSWMTRQMSHSDPVIIKRQQSQQSNSLLQHTSSGDPPPLLWSDLQRQTVQVSRGRRGTCAATCACARDLTCSVVPVQDGQSEEGSVAVGGEGGFGQSSQVVHVIEPRPVCVVVARQQQVDVVRSLEQEAGQ